MNAAHAWANAEFGKVNLSDARLNRRLIVTAAHIRENPCGTLTRTITAKSELKGAYRLFENEKVKHLDILQPHLEKTRQACRATGEYLLIEDTTECSFSQRGNIPGMGPLTHKTSQGFLAHTCLATRIERWNTDATPELTVMGLFGQECWARETHKGSLAQRKKKKRQQKMSGNYSPESDRWGRCILSVASPPSGTQWTLVADRESDIFSLMTRCQEHGVDFILRAAQLRKALPEGKNVFTVVAKTPVLGHFVLSLRSRPGVKAREASLEVRAFSTVIKPPRENPQKLGALPVNLVDVREINAPEEEEPVHWLLLTSWSCEGFSQAMRVVQGYASRWLIEEYHKALKTGTNIEDSQLSTYDRISALFAVHAVVAVDLLAIKLLARTRPDEPVSADIISSEALQVLEHIHGRPEKGWTNDLLCRTIARMGGYQDRKSDGPPGWLTIWRGWLRLTVLLEGFLLAKGERICG